ncbi:hypothetical protein BJP40_23615 [Streptomyces sp. CC53]|nr:hypothetical protein BJP40_23615 [Streptomyces sp. CC53]
MEAGRPRRVRRWRLRELAVGLPAARGEDDRAVRFTVQPADRAFAPAASGCRSAAAMSYAKPRSAALTGPHPVCTWWRVFDGLAFVHGGGRRLTSERLRTASSKKARETVGHGAPNVTGEKDR